MLCVAVAFVCASTLWAVVTAPTGAPRAPGLVLIAVGALMTGLLVRVPAVILSERGLEVGRGLSGRVRMKLSDIHEVRVSARSVTFVRVEGRALTQSRSAIPSTGLDELLLALGRAGVTVVQG